VGAVDEWLLIRALLAIGLTGLGAVLLHTPGMHNAGWFILGFGLGIFVFSWWRERTRR
jgi:hypothetical protein